MSRVIFLPPVIKVVARTHPVACRDVKVTESSESVLAGTKRPPFRLVVRAVFAPGEASPPVILPTVSEEFVVGSLASPCTSCEAPGLRVEGGGVEGRGTGGSQPAMIRPPVSEEFVVGGIRSLQHAVGRIRSLQHAGHLSWGLMSPACGGHPSAHSGYEMWHCQA